MNSQTLTGKLSVLPAAKIMRDQGKLFKIPPSRFLVPLIHPAAALRSTNVLEALEASFKKLPAILAKIDELSAMPADDENNRETDQKVSQESLF